MNISPTCIIENCGARVEAQGWACAQCRHDQMIDALASLEESVDHVGRNITNVAAELERIANTMQHMLPEQL